MCIRDSLSPQRRDVPSTGVHVLSDMLGTGLRRSTAKIDSQGPESVPFPILRPASSHNWKLPL
eukprot:15128554-Alexandrium_andersonii.AAC.1